MTLDSAPDRLRPLGAPRRLHRSRGFLPGDSGATRKRFRSRVTDRLGDARDDIRGQQMASWVFITVSDEGA